MQCQVLRVWQFAQSLPAGLPARQADWGQQNLKFVATEDTRRWLREDSCRRRRRGIRWGDLREPLLRTERECRQPRSLTRHWG